MNSIQSKKLDGNSAAAAARMDLHTQVVRGLLAALAGSVILLVFLAESHGQRIRAIRGDFGGLIVEDTPIPDEKIDDTEGAGLKTDPDLESLLKKAERYREDGNYRIAAKLWQAVLEKSGDALFSEDGKTYYSLGQQVENIIAKLPAEGLQMYRITADASAKEILAVGSQNGRVGALSKIVKEYFVSSIGDEAAFELGNHYLDRFDFIGAIRLHRKIVDSYPDPSIDLSEVWLRLALSYAYVGNKSASDEAMAKAKEIAGGNNAEKIAQISTAIQNADAYIKDSKEQESWSMRLGNQRRTGVMPRFPLSVFEQDLHPIWTYAIDPRNEYSPEHVQGQVTLKPPTDFISSNDKKLADSWSKNHWRPSGELLFTKDLMFYKTGADLSVWKKNAKDTNVYWRPLWLNRFDYDGATEVLLSMRRYNNNGPFASNAVPKEHHSILDFSDEIHQTMAIYKGVVYTVEGKEYSDPDELPRRRTQNFNYGTTPRRTRINNLTAYNIETGQFMWRYPPLDAMSNEKPKKKDPAEDDEEETGVMGSPIGYGNLLLVPVNSGGSIWVHALDIEKGGKRVWKSFLCDEPSTGSKQWASILMTLEGSDLYVNCGYGAFFVLDPATGSVRFARRYARRGTVNTGMRNIGIQTTMLKLRGFSHDLLIPHGNHLVLLASDHDEIAGYDRQTGAKVWKAPAHDIFGTKVDYVIGVYDNYLYAASDTNVIAYDLDGDGRMIWTAEKHFSGISSDGRGMVTPDGVFMPIGQTIVQFDLKTGKVLNRVGVRLPGRSPVGNLYSDGEKLWILNGNRVMALGPVPDEPEKTEPSEEDNEDKGTEEDKDAKKEDKK